MKVAMVFIRVGGLQMEKLFPGRGFWIKSFAAGTPDGVYAHPSDFSGYE